VRSLVALVVLLLAGCVTAGGPAPGGPAAGEVGISVSGTGRVSLAPDIVTVDLGAEARAPQLTDATAEVWSTVVRSRKPIAPGSPPTP